VVCVPQESRGAIPGDRPRFPAPNVPTGNAAVAVNDPGSRRPPYLVVDPGYSLTGQSHVAQHPGVQLHTDICVKTNEHLANIQPQSTGKLFHWPAI